MPIPKTVWLGAPDTYNNSIVYVSGNYGVNPITLSGSTGYNFFMDPVLGASSYSWSLPSGGGFSFLGGTPSTNAAIIRTGSTDGTYQIICTPQGCGAAGSRYLTVIIDSGGIIQLRAAYPNPTNDLFIVKLKETESSEVAEISLTNKFLEKVYTLKTPEKEISISTQNLPDGTYYLNILLGKELTQKQVLVKH